MRLIRDLTPGARDSRRMVVTIGNFDGVHIGHQAVIKQVHNLASEKGLLATVVCFEPMPREYFSAAKAPPRLTRLRRKFVLIAKHGIDQLVCLRFNKVMAHMSAEGFIEHVLIRSLRARYVIVGEDFRFGRDRKGDINLLKEKGNATGFDVVAAATVQVQGARASSTSVREALATGNLKLAAQLLGSPFTLEGHVRHGEKIGRQLGFPTANVHTGPYRLPLHGVFAGTITLRDGRRQRAAVSIGTRPVLGKISEELLEVHLLDFDENLYGQRLEVALQTKLRDETGFDGFDALRVQIERDVQQVRKLND